MGIKNKLIFKPFVKVAIKLVGGDPDKVCIWQEVLEICEDVTAPDRYISTKKRTDSK